MHKKSACKQAAINMQFDLSMAIKSWCPWVTSCFLIYTGWYKSSQLYIATSTARPSSCLQDWHLYILLLLKEIGKAGFWKYDWSPQHNLKTTGQKITRWRFQKHTHDTGIYELNQQWDMVQVFCVLPEDFYVISWATLHPQTHFHKPSVAFVFCIFKIKT